jgi:hypothetical protein
MRKNYLFSMWLGDTYLDIHGSADPDEPSLGHIGGIDIEDVFICDTKTSVLEMIHALNFDEFVKQAEEAYSELDKT